MKKLKHVKTFESWFKNPFKSDKIDRYKSNYIDARGSFTKDEILIFETIDMLRDMGYRMSDKSGELTDSAYIWLVNNLQVYPNFNKRKVSIYNNHNDNLIESIPFGSPEEMASKISDVIEQQAPEVNIRGYLN